MDILSLRSLLLSSSCFFLLGFLVYFHWRDIQHWLSSLYFAFNYPDSCYITCFLLSIPPFLRCQPASYYSIPSFPALNKACIFNLHWTWFDCSIATLLTVLDHWLFLVGVCDLWPVRRRDMGGRNIIIAFLLLFLFREYLIAWAFAFITLARELD